MKYCYEQLKLSFILLSSVVSVADQTNVHSDELNAMNSRNMDGFDATNLQFQDLFSGTRTITTEQRRKKNQPKQKIKGETGVRAQGLLPCTGSQIEAGLEIMSDSKPEETSWFIMNCQMEFVATSDNYTALPADNWAEYYFCIEPVGIYFFAILDSGGDGITDGYYMLFIETPDHPEYAYHYTTTELPVTGDGSLNTLSAPYGEDYGNTFEDCLTTAPSSFPSKVASNSPSVVASSVPSKNPSMIPSLSSFPSMSPSISNAPSESLMPSLSSAPSHISASPSIDFELLRDNWTIAFEEAYPTINNTDLFDGLTLEYSISKKKIADQIAVKILDESCTTEINSEAISVAMKSVKIDNTSEYRDKGLISIKVNETSIKETVFWSEESDGSKGLISFCVRSELLLAEDPSVSVSFIDTKAYFTLNFVAEFATFEIEDIELVKLNVTEVNKVSKFQVEACICNKGMECYDDQILKQNEPFTICVYSHSDQLEIIEYESIVLYQDGEAKYLPVKNSLPDHLTTLSFGQIGTVKTRLLSSFFTDDVLSSVSISGEVMLDFVRDRRLLNGENSIIHVTSEEYKVEDKRGNFEFHVSIEKSQNLFSIEFVGYCVIAVTLCAAIFRRKSDGVKTTYSPLQNLS